MSALPSDEVAQDYRDALDDLMNNDRYQIANLTMIAKENIEHAEAISRVLISHIKKVTPTRKLPALYVLDSLVKNIGSPYTVYFGRNLYDTFMLAFSQVDDQVRKKLGEMLKTWREPVPGSLSNVPVFPLTTTQAIVDALNKFYANAAQQRMPPYAVPPHIQSPAFGQQAVPYRATPTPPQSQFLQPPVTAPTPVYAPPTPQFAQVQPQYQHFVQPPQPQYVIPSQNGRYQNLSGIDITKLHADIDDLTTDAKIECTTHPMDRIAQKKLQTLQQLKEILDSGTASDQDVQDIRTSITQQLAKRAAEQQQSRASLPIPQSMFHQPVQPPQWTQPLPYQQAHSQYPPTQHQHPQSMQVPALGPAPLSTPVPEPLPSAPAFLNTTNLADLLRATATPAAQAAVHSANSIGDVFASLRASGVLDGGHTAGRTPPTRFAQLSLEDVPFTSAAMKIPRPHLYLRYMTDRPNQCGQCGRRFTSDEVGKVKKEKHLDWHFKTKQRMIEAEQRGQNRSWYMDEREWIASKEFNDDEGLEDGNGPTGTVSSTEVVKKQEDFVRAPSDPAVRKLPCPIDQEPFKSEWSAEIQDFIWRDAVKVGERYYHASCFREMTKGKDLTGRASPLGRQGHRRTATPDSVLGKRKAGEDEPPPGSKARVKLEA